MPLLAFRLIWRSLKRAMPLCLKRFWRQRPALDDSRCGTNRIGDCSKIPMTLRAAQCERVATEWANIRPEFHANSAEAFFADRLGD